MNNNCPGCVEKCEFADCHTPECRTRTVYFDSRDIYDDSYDGGYGEGSYFSWAMGKDD